MWVAYTLKNYSIELGKATTEPIVVWTLVIKKYYEFGVDLHLVFINYKQAYYSINRNASKKDWEYWKYQGRI